MMTTEEICSPNHHAHYPGFAGLTGWIAAASMVTGRKDSARLAQRLSGLRADDEVVDVGCGPGAAVRSAARLGATAVGIDPAPVMLQFARVLTRTATKVRFEEGSAEDLPVPDASATVVWSIASVHHWTDVDLGVREARRVLKPGGRLVAIERRRQPGARGHASHGWTEGQAGAFAERCLALGFLDARVDRHDSGRRPTLSVTATR